jgi:hypothetical protein
MWIRGAQRVIAADFGERALGELNGFRGVIPAKVGQIQKDSGTHGPRRDLVCERLEQRPRTAEITRGGVAQARLDESPPASLPILRGGALRRQLRQLGRDGRSASLRSMLRRLLERLGNLRVGAFGPEREMPGSLFGVDDDLCQPCMDLPAPLRADPGDDCRR